MLKAFLLCRLPPSCPWPQMATAFLFSLFRKKTPTLTPKYTEALVSQQGWEVGWGLPELSAAGLKASSACGSLVRAMLIVPKPFYFSSGLAVLLWTKALSNRLKLSEVSKAQEGPLFIPAPASFCPARQ